MPRVSVRYLAAVADYTGRKEEEFELPDGATVKDLLDTIREKYPRVAEIERRFPLLILRNGVNAKPEDRLVDGDRVALLPPVSGGSRFKPPAEYSYGCGD